jgi:uncharacterized protein YndB with AHSA1/START domain
MTNDLTRLLGVEERRVLTRERDGQPAKVIVATRRYDTTLEDLWDALTNPGRIPRWFLPITGDLRLGGRYQLQGNAGGTITRCDPPTRFDATWEARGDVSWIEVTLSPDPAGGTRLRLEHTARPPREFWDQYGPGSVGVGWDLSFYGLARHLSGAPPMNSAQAGAWMASDEGKAMILASSEAWIQASIADGTDAAAARAAGDRTTVFYGATPPAA